MKKKLNIVSNIYILLLKKSPSDPSSWNIQIASSQSYSFSRPTHVPYSDHQAARHLVYPHNNSINIPILCLRKLCNHLPEVTHWIYNWLTEI